MCTYACVYVAVYDCAFGIYVHMGMHVVCVLMCMCIRNMDMCVYVYMSGVCMHGCM